MKRFLLPALVAVICASFSACRDTTGVAVPPLDLARARDRWTQHGIHDYQFTLQVTCFCVNTNPMMVTVLHDTVFAVTDGVTHQSLNRSEALTVTALFDLIKQSFKDGTPIEATYDPTLGYPTKIVSNAPEMAVDGGAIYVVSDLSAGVFVVN